MRKTSIASTGRISKMKTFLDGFKAFRYAIKSMLLHHEKKELPRAYLV
jgi:hypothetical protein